MSEHHELAGALQEENWARIERIVERFEDAWRQGNKPSLSDYLRGSETLLPGLLVELIRAELEFRLQAGEAARVEKYLTRYPELADERQAVLALLQTEWRMRARIEPQLSVEEYQRRFPELAQELTGVLCSDSLERQPDLPATLDWPKQHAHPSSPSVSRTTSADLDLPGYQLNEQLGKGGGVGFPHPGTHLGEYELLNELGRGGMGIVYQALDRQRGRRIALKTIQGMNAEAIYRFKQEFRLRADLHHPNLVSLYELIAGEGRWFFTMELVEGSDFLSYVRGGADALGPPAAAPLATAEQFQRLRQSLRQLVAGTEVLHTARRLHRDLKPSNVMVTRSGRVVLLDFGLTAPLNAQQIHESTTRHLLGTAAYMSPEQARSEALTPASDWYSVGVMLYEALTGRLPFVGSTFQILSDKQQFDPPPPRALAPGIPEDLDALCIALLSRDPAARSNGRHCLRLLGDSSGDSTPSLELHAPEVALVGRTEQLAALADAYTASRNRRTVALFLSGSSGVGKSSLLQEFLKQLRTEGEAVVLTGQCYEQESVPYKAFDGVIDALGRYLRRLSPLEVQALLPRAVSSLLRVFPTLRRVETLLSVPQGREAPDPQEVRQRAFASLRELLARLADRKPVVISIDDLQWGDADSAALLTDLIRPPDAPCLLFVVCHRNEETASPFLTALAESNRLLWSEVDRRDVRLDPLSLAEAEELARRLLTSMEAAEGCAAAIARESGGNPFFVYELVRYLCGELGRSLSEGAIGLGEVLRRRIEQLSTEARELLSVVALAARPLPQDVACRAAGLANGRIEELTLLRSQRLVRGTGMSGEDLLITYHDRIREIFRAHLCAEDARRLHGRLAEALEVWGHADDEWLAMHWDCAGEKRRAGEYYGRAADQAAETLAFDNAADLYRRALLVGPEDPGLSQQLQRKLGDALANAGRGGEAAKEYQVLVAKASGEEAIELQRRVAEQFLISGYVEEGLAAAQSLLHSLRISMPRTPTQAVLGLLLMRAWLWIRGIKFRERSEAEVTTGELCRVDASWVMGKALGLIDPVRGAHFQIRNLLLAIRAGEPYRVARALAMEAAYNAVGGPSTHDRSSRLLAIAESLARRIENPHAGGLLLLARGLVGYLEGRWRDTLDDCSRAETFLRSHCTGVHWDLRTAQTFQVWSLSYLGEIVVMNGLCSRFMKEAQSRGDLQGIANLLLFAMPVLSMTADNAEQGYQELSDGLTRWMREGFNAQQSNALYMKTQLLLYLDRVTVIEHVNREHSKGKFQSRLSRVQHLRMSQYELTARVHLRLARDARSPAPYLKASERCAARLDREKRPDAQSFAKLIRAGVANCKGDIDTAKKLLESALSGLAACELGLFAAAARRRLGQLIGGDQGKSFIAEADRWMTAQGIRNPARMTAVYAPGFDDP